MYHGCVTEVWCAVGKTSPFIKEVGVHQGSLLSPFMFATVMDYLMEEVRREAPWNMLFADDMVLISEAREGAEEKLGRWRKALESIGLKVNTTKTEHVCMNKGGHDGVGEQVKTQGQVVPKVEDSKYLGSTITCDGRSDGEVKKGYRQDGIIRER